jgi:hypothetical protein
MNACPVCRPYPNPGYQQMEDGSEVPCFGCNRQEFEKSALSTECGQPERDLALLKRVIYIIPQF